MTNEELANELDRMELHSLNPDRQFVYPTARDRIRELNEVIAERDAALATLAQVRVEILSELDALGYGDGSGMGTFNRLTGKLRLILDEADS